MSDKTGIEWTDATWNPLVGCSRVSQGCTNCYAERHAYRFSGQAGSVYEGTARMVNGKPTFTGRVNVNRRVLDQPMRWKRPRRIFVNSMSDVFHESVSDGTILGLFAVMAASPQHQFQILTKRPERALEWFTRVQGMAHGDVGTLLHEAAKGLFGYTDRRRPVIQADSVQWPLPNVWLGVSVEDQAAADERIPLLLRTPAAIRFLSCEPLLGPVSLRWLAAFNGKALRGDQRTDHLDGLRAIDWVIAGGESGPRARPMHPDWARSLRDQCATAGVPFFFKQWGEFVSQEQTAYDLNFCYENSRIGGWVSPTGERWMGEAADPKGSGNAHVFRLGKKAAACTLDGAVHHAFPTLHPPHRRLGEVGLHGMAHLPGLHGPGDRPEL